MSDDEVNNDDVADADADAEVSDDLLQMATEYVAATARCKSVAERVKQLRDAKASAAENLLQAFEDEEVDQIKLPTGETVKRYVAKQTEKITDEFVTEQLTSFLGSHDNVKASAAKRASRATQYMFERRAVDECYRVSVRNPPKKRAAAPKKKGKAIISNDDVPAPAAAPAKKRKHGDWNA